MEPQPSDLDTLFENYSVERESLRRQLEEAGILVPGATARDIECAHAAQPLKKWCYKLSRLWQLEKRLLPDTVRRITEEHQGFFPSSLQPTS